MGLTKGGARIGDSRDLLSHQGQATSRHDRLGDIEFQDLHRVTSEDPPHALRVGGCDASRVVLCTHMSRPRTPSLARGFSLSVDKKGLRAPFVMGGLISPVGRRQPPHSADAGHCVIRFRPTPSRTGVNPLAWPEPHPKDS